MRKINEKFFRGVERQKGISLEKPSTPNNPTLTTESRLDTMADRTTLCYWILSSTTKENVKVTH